MMRPGRYSLHSIICCCKVKYMYAINKAFMCINKKAYTLNIDDFMSVITN